MKDKTWWRTEGFFVLGGKLIRDGDADRTLEEIKDLLTIPEVTTIKVTKK